MLQSNTAKSMNQKQSKMILALLNAQANSSCHGFSIKCTCNLNCQITKSLQHFWSFQASLNVTSVNVAIQVPFLLSAWHSRLKKTNKTILTSFMIVLQICRSSTDRNSKTVSTSMKGILQESLILQLVTMIGPWKVSLSATVMTLNTV